MLLVHHRKISGLEDVLEIEHPIIIHPIISLHWRYRSTHSNFLYPDKPTYHGRSRDLLPSRQKLQSHHFRNHTQWLN